MNIKKWFKSLFVRRQKSIAMFNGEKLYKRIIPEVVSIEPVGRTVDNKEFYFTLHLTEKSARSYYSDDRDSLESERTRLIEWVDSWK